MSSARSFSRCMGVFLVALLAATVTVLAPYTQDASAATADDDLRVVAVAQVVGALESYGSANQSYKVDGAGYNGKGFGWYQLVNGGTYATSFVEILVDGGHLDADNVLLDPKDTVLGSHSSYDFRIRLCENRVAVFSRADELTPDVADAAWWADNGCSSDNPNSAPAISDDLLETVFGARHRGTSSVTSFQTTGYADFRRLHPNRTRITWSEMKEIEVKAIMQSNAFENALKEPADRIIIDRVDVEALLQESIDQLKAQGVPTPHRIPGAPA